jgi:hypothetical protein
VIAVEEKKKKKLMNKIVSFQTMCPLLFRKGDKVAAVLSYLP